MLCPERGPGTMREQSMGERSGGENGRSPHERREEAIREDRALKREVDEALREWDRLEEGSPAPVAEPARRARRNVLS